MTMLLYADEFVEQDPLSFEQYFAGPFDPETSREVLAWRCLDTLEILLQVKPLIDAGIIVLVPIDDDPSESVIDDDLDAEFDDYLIAHGYAPDQTAGLTPAEPWYLRDARRTALKSDAILIPTHAHHWHYLAFLDDRAGRGDTAGKPSATTQKVATSLLTLELPIFAGAPIDTLVKIHENEAAFADWRAALRSSARQINRNCTDEGFEVEAKEVYDDLLLPMTAAVQRATKRSKVLRDLTVEQSARVALGATLGYGSSTFLGIPPAGSVAGAVVGGITSAAYGMMRPEKPNGAASIISLLTSSSRR
jgi:hypothetical protein